MTTVKKSFLSHIIGKESYDAFKGYAKPIVLFGTIIVFFLFFLSILVHWRFVSWLLNLVSGTSILFLIYTAALIILLDKEVEIEEPILDYEYDSKQMPKTRSFKMTILRGVVLLILGMLVIILSNRYRKQYSFECSTILVDQSAGIYHLEWIDECEVAAKSYNLKKMKGYEIKGLGYKLCDWCKEYAEEVEEAKADYYSDRI